MRLFVSLVEMNLKHSPDHKEAVLFYKYVLLLLELLCVM